MAKLLRHLLPPSQQGEQIEGSVTQSDIEREALSTGELEAEDLAQEPGKRRILTDVDGDDPPPFVEVRGSDPVDVDEPPDRFAIGGDLRRLEISGNGLYAPIPQFGLTHGRDFG